MRSITVISTQNGHERVVNSSATTWGQLKSEIGQYYDLEALKATEATNRTILEYDDSILPSGDFTLYLRPGKVKSGN